MHGGNLDLICRQFNKKKSDLIDFSVSINPLGFPGNTRKIISGSVSSLDTYPDPNYTALRAVIADFENCPVERVTVVNGSSEGLFFILFALKPARILLPVPCYTDYQTYAENLHIPVDSIDLQESDNFTLDCRMLQNKLQESIDGTAVLLAVPNNPIGNIPDLDNIKSLAQTFPKSHFILDLAYADLCGIEIPSVNENIIIMKSLTKLFALPGIRIGYAVSAPETAQKVRKILPVWNVNTIAADLAGRLLPEKHFIIQTQQTVAGLRKTMTAELGKIPRLKVYPGDANFILFSIMDNEPARFYEYLVNRNLVLRWCKDYTGLTDKYFRIGLRGNSDNEKLLSTIREYFEVSGNNSKRRKKPALMFQGTSSNAGKSLMTAAYCRVLSNLGYNVGPFKAQNMSLNSAVTAEGGEIGRAQVLQAAAARTEPHTDMNPVLLKPNSDTGSQVIVNGQVWKNLEALDYYASKDYLRKEVHAAYDRLAERYDVLVLEGAGSPGEVNLKKHDMVNMSMAKYAESQVMLVGDIDRGGVYASFIGHMEVMDEWERQLVSGFIVNKFRGDARLLEDAHSYLLEYTQKKVAGIIPYMENHRLPEEDGVDFEERYGRYKPGQDSINVGIVALPHISNSTDIDPLLNFPECRLKKLSTPADIDGESIHLVIIPGSKNVISDLRSLKKNGIADSIIRKYNAGEICVLGICGGFQMLGREILDPLGIESQPGNRERRLGLLNVKTELAKNKTLELTSTECVLTGKEVKGYEIHHGVSEYSTELFSTPGLGTWNTAVWGTYLHGILENDSFTSRLLEETAGFHNLPVKLSLNTRKKLDEALDDFAACFKESTDLDFLLKETGL